MAVSLPLLIIAFTYIYKGIAGIKDRIKHIMLFLIILFTYLAGRFIVFHGLGGYDSYYMNYIVFVLTIPIRYLLNIVWQFFIIALAPVNLFFLLIYLIFIGFTLYKLINSKLARKKTLRNKHKLFYLSWMLITIIPLFSTALPWQIYLPSVGFASLGGYFISENLSKFKTGKMRILNVLALSFWILLFITLIIQNLQTQNEFRPESGKVAKADIRVYNHKEILHSEQQKLLTEKLKRLGYLDSNGNIIKNITKNEKMTYMDLYLKYRKPIYKQLLKNNKKEYQ